MQAELDYSAKLMDALISMGPGGVLAGVIFWFYRQDRKEMLARLLVYADDFKAIVQDNTKAIQSNTDCIKNFIERDK